ncbi:L,D-transpeptidase family protein [Roseococcus sp. XZZS9]|uniref:L,D-transpeptidase family protein n=1 Tax=Roseococcus pinisoli TaxID=2835040 RepID=A0ABS5QJ81_9PROT|nr:L,D-transpeptidase family protein [Roseococcus pinisoli]MBS7813632.1 L,D-transpeptidase family protein [Roseococcus pinisoli]
MPVLPRAPKPSRLRHGPSEPALADERLNTDLLRRFYARHGFAPVWTSRPAEAEALVNIVLRAGEHGLDPELFQAEQLQRRATLPPPDRDVLLSAAFLSYAEALAQGAVPADQRRDGEALSPEPVDVVAALDAAMDSVDPAAAITALAPATPAYRELRQALQLYRAGELARGAAAAGRLRRIEVNLERQRWLPRQLPADRVWVNVADQQLELYLADRPVFSTRIVVGQDALRNQSPEFRTAIEAGFLNPPWVIPRDIVTAEILPRLLRDPDYLERNNMLLRPNGEVEQAPGPEAGLGQIMFDMPNRFDVYLHDTPDRSVFERDNRRISHGCIRVQNPLELAALLMRRPIDSLHREIATGSTTRANLPTPVAVFVTYQTVFLDSDGTLQFRPDFYNRDLGIWRQLRARPQGSPPRLQAEMRPTSSAPVPL